MTPDERAQALVAEMTFEEKVSFMHAHGFTNPYVGHTPAVPRLKIPEFNYQDGPQGVRTGYLTTKDHGTSTAWPSGLTMGASWDPELMRSWGDAMAEEFYNKGAHV